MREMPSVVARTARNVSGRDSSSTISRGRSRNILPVPKDILRGQSAC